MRAKGTGLRVQSSGQGRQIRKKNKRTARKQDLKTINFKDNVYKRNFRIPHMARLHSDCLVYCTVRVVEL
jgi:hypothetical protein